MDNLSKIIAESLQLKLIQEANNGNSQELITRIATLYSLSEKLIVCFNEIDSLISEIKTMPEFIQLVQHLEVDKRNESYYDDHTNNK